MHAVRNGSPADTSPSLLGGPPAPVAVRCNSSHLTWTGTRYGFGAEPVSERVVADGKIVTAAGVSAGIDMALTLLGQASGARTAQTVQLAVEYAPEPPFDAGSPATAPVELRELALRLIGAATR
jgi:hypothetical protein